MFIYIYIYKKDRGSGGKEAPNYSQVVYCSPLYSLA